MAKRRPIRPANADNQLISKFTLRILKAGVIIANLLTVIIPCKWNFKKQRYQTDRSVWMLLFILIHLTGRVGAIGFVLSYLLVKFNRVEFESWDFVFCMIILLWCMASTMIFSLSLNHPTFLPVVLNRVISINSSFGEDAEDNKANKTVAVAIAGLIAAMVFGPIVVCIAWIVDVQLIVFLHTWLVEIVRQIARTSGPHLLVEVALSFMSAESLALLILCLACEYFAITEGVLWLIYGVVMLLMLFVMKHCVVVHKW